MWFPFLDPPSCKQQLSGLKPQWNSKYCMFLMLMALGSMAENESIENGLFLAEEYASPAFSMMPVVMFDGSLAAVHCFILYRYGKFPMCLTPSIYLGWVLKPATAFNFVCHASVKIQQIIYWYLSPTQRLIMYRRPQLQKPAMPEELELEKRAFWTIHILEK